MSNIHSIINGSVSPSGNSSSDNLTARSSVKSSVSNSSTLSPLTPQDSKIFAKPPQRRSVDLYQPNSDGHRYLHNNLNALPTYNVNGFVDPIDVPSSKAPLYPNKKKTSDKSYPDKVTSSYANMVGKEYSVFDSLEISTKTGLPTNISKIEQARMRNMGLSPDIDYKSSSELAHLHRRLVIVDYGRNSKDSIYDFREFDNVPKNNTHRNEAAAADEAYILKRRRQRLSKRLEQPNQGVIPAELVPQQTSVSPKRKPAISSGPSTHPSHLSSSNSHIHPGSSRDFSMNTMNSITSFPQHPEYYQHQGSAAQNTQHMIPSMPSIPNGSLGLEQARSNKLRDVEYQHESQSKKPHARKHSPVSPQDMFQQAQALQDYLSHMTLINILDASFQYFSPSHNSDAFAYLQSYCHFYILKQTTRAEFDTFLSYVRVDKDVKHHEDRIEAFLSEMKKWYQTEKTSNQTNTKTIRIYEVLERVTQTYILGIPLMERPDGNKSLGNDNNLHNNYNKHSNNNNLNSNYVDYDNYDNHNTHNHNSKNNNSNNNNNFDQDNLNNFHGHPANGYFSRNTGGDSNSNDILQDVNGTYLSVGIKRMLNELSNLRSRHLPNTYINQVKELLSAICERVAVGW